MLTRSILFLMLNANWLEWMNKSNRNYDKCWWWWWWWSPGWRHVHIEHVFACAYVWGSGRTSEREEVNEWVSESVKTRVPFRMMRQKEHNIVFNKFTHVSLINRNTNKIQYKTICGCFIFCPKIKDEFAWNIMRMNFTFDYLELWIFLLGTTNDLYASKCN